MKIEKLELLMASQNVDPNLMNKIEMVLAYQAKVKAIQDDIKDLKEEIMVSMENSQHDKIYTTKGVATYKKGDRTSIKKDLVLDFLDRLNCGMVSTGTIEDVSETKESCTLSIRPFKDLN